MRVFILILLLVIIQNAAKASDSLQFRGGHPLVVSLVWDNTITLKEAAVIQACIDSHGDKPDHVTIAKKCIETKGQ